MLRSLFLLTLLLLGACDSAPKLNIGSVAPAFTTIYMDGTAARFPEDFRGKPVVIRFWAEWCRFCEGEMKDIEQVYQRRREQGLLILAVNAGQDKATITSFMQKIGASYPALLDDGSAITRSYGVVGLPTTYFVGADGLIKAKVVGEADVATFDKLAGELMNATR
jgi:peroxiredoxin